MQAHNYVSEPFTRCIGYRTSRQFCNFAAYETVKKSWLRSVAQSRTEHKPTVHKVLPAAHSDSETVVYERPMQPLRTHTATLVASRVCKHGGNI